MLTKSVLCGMMVFCFGCVSSGYNVRGSVGVDYHVTDTQPTPIVSARVSFESK